jgi:hypothetical protein
MGLVLAILGALAFMALAGSSSAAPGASTVPPTIRAKFDRARLMVSTDPVGAERLANELRASGYPGLADEIIALIKTRAVADSPATSPQEKTMAAAITATAQVLAEPAKATASSVSSKSGIVVIAQKVSDHLNALIKARGGVARAKGREDQSMIRDFQAKTALKVDGKYGPKSAAMLGRYVGDVPIVFYWPTGSQPSVEVPKYRSNLHTLALEAVQVNDNERGKLLEFSAAREKGQGYGSTVKVPVTTRDPRPVQTADETLKQQVAIILSPTKGV